MSIHFSDAHEPTAKPLAHEPFEGTLHIETVTVSFPQLKLSRQLFLVSIAFISHEHL